jgi:hypothetical protein
MLRTAFFSPKKDAAPRVEPLVAMNEMNVVFTKPSVPMMMSKHLPGVYPWGHRTNIQWLCLESKTAEIRGINPHRPRYLIRPRPRATVHGESCMILATPFEQLPQFRR